MKTLFKLAIMQVKRIHESIEDRVDLREFRVNSLKELNQPMVKVAFDTRRINQQTDYIPRRNLQFYHRSEPFITKDASEKLKTFFKLKTAIDTIKEDFLGDPEWHDSYCRILSLALDRTLRIEQQDMDFFKPQMDYLEELLYLRYRLKEDDIVKLNEEEIRNIVLNKDEKLLNKQIYSNYNRNDKIIKENVASHQMTNVDDRYDRPVRETKTANNTITNKEPRSVNITINIADDVKKGE